MALNWTNALTGAAGGGLTGAGLGTALGPWGTGIGGALGAIAGGISGLVGGNADAQTGQESNGLEWLFGTPEGLKLFNQFSPEQQQALTQARDQALQQLQNPYEGFEPIRQNALNTFFQDIVPRLQHQFSASGQNAISSPVLQTNLSSAGSNLAQQLAAQQSQYGLQNRGLALQQLSLGLKPMYGQTQQAGSQGVFGSTSPYLAKGLVGGLSGYYGAKEGDRNFDVFRNSALKSLAGGV